MKYLADLQICSKQLIVTSKQTLLTGSFFPLFYQFCDFNNFFLSVCFIDCVYIDSQRPDVPFFICSVKEFRMVSVLGPISTSSIYLNLCDSIDK